MRLRQVAATFGTPAYVYCTDAVEARLEALRAAFGRWFTLSYAVKCNPNPALLGWMRDRVDHLDVSSLGEFRHGRAAGWEAGRASFTGPAKQEYELREAIAGGIGELVLENLREARLANAIAGELGLVQDVLIRLAPSSVPKGFGDQMAGRPSPFGFDIETAAEDLPPLFVLPHLRVAGLHVYSGTQCLKPEAICENYRIFMGIFRAVCEAHDLVPDRLVFGSGLGIPYHPGDVPLDLDAIVAGMGAELDAFRAEPRFANTGLVLELGRYLVGEAGYFLTRVVSVKTSRGVRIGMCDGGMNAHLAASGHFGMVIHRNYLMHRVAVPGEVPGEAEKINLTGPLCTSIDRLAGGAMLPRLEEGDLVAIHSSGAYGPTASPLHFISHRLPREVLSDGTGLLDATRRLEG